MFRQNVIILNGNIVFSIASSFLASALSDILLCAEIYRERNDGVTRSASFGGQRLIRRLGRSKE